MWLDANLARWFFDRVVRLARILKTGVRRATVTEIGDSSGSGGGIVRVNLPRSLLEMAAMPKKTLVSVRHVISIAYT
jgi:hypothetical protein